MHYSLLLCLGLVLVVSLLVMLAQRLRISYPIFLVMGGLAISFIPGLPRVEIDPELIFLIFLPPLLYEAAWFTSWKDFWKWRRVVITLAFGLVILTSSMVAWVSSAMIPGFTLSLGFLLGGIISPPDAVAASSVLKGMDVPKRVTSVLEGESLVNDASSLIVFRFALVAVLTGSFVWQQAAVSFVLVTVMGIIIGLAIAFIMYAIHRWLPTTPSIDTALTFVAPYLMYLAAESMHFSGVMAVVSGGLFLSYKSHEIFSHATRLQAVSMWATVGFILNGLVFMLIGLELPVIINNLGNYSKTEALMYALVITFVIIIARIGCAFGMSLFTKFISRFIRTNDSNPGWKLPLIVGWAGMRGVVSLASALSIPIYLSGDKVFPQRNLILFITFIVILVTLVIQGLTLPWLIKLVKLEDPDHWKPEHEQEAEIQLHLLSESLQALEKRYDHETRNNDLVRKLKENIENQVRFNTNLLESEDCDVAEKKLIEEHNRVFLDLLDVQRHALHVFRTKDGYADELIRKVESQIDFAEARLRGAGEE